MIVNRHFLGPEPRNRFADILHCFADIGDDYIARLGVSQSCSHFVPNMRHHFLR